MSESSGYFRWPAVHGDRVVFVSEDDLWEVPLGGGDARRMTSGLGEVGHPMFSPDGQKIAYVGTEEGAREIFVMSSAGGPGRQLTFLASISAVVGWSDDSHRVLFRSNAGQFSRRIQTVFEVDTEGGQPIDLKLGAAHWVAREPGGRGEVLGRNADDLARWKRYRGGTAGKLWIDRGTGWQPLLAQMTSGLVRPMWIGERIYFVNDEDGTGNICSCALDGSEFRQHTQHSGFYARFAQTDGTTIVYSVGGALWRFTPATGQGAQIDVAYPSPRTQLNRKFVDAADYLGEWSLHPRGHSMAATSRGKLFTFGNWEGAVWQLGQGQGVRYRLPLSFDDGKQLLVISDAGGEEFLEIYSSDSDEPRKLTGPTIGRPTLMRLSPDEKRVAVSNHRHELLIVDMTTGEVTVADRSPSMWVDGFDWSGDSRWVAYAVHDSSKTSLIRVLDTTTMTARDLTQPGFRDSAPCFDPEGRYLYFVSSRWFDPVYDSLFFELSFPKSARPCVVTLKADEPSLFLEKARPLDGDDDDGDDKDSEKSEAEAKDDKKVDAKDDKKDEDEPPEPVEIDFDGIADRVEAFPVPVGHYGTIRATAENVFWAVYLDPESDSETQGSPGMLQSFDLDKRKVSTFAREISDFELSTDRKTVAYECADGLRVVSAAGDGPNDDEPETTTRKSGWIDLSRLPVSVEPVAEWRQMLRESWRLMRDQFWSADLCGVDWDSVWDRYSPMVDRVASRSEFSDLVWTMQGELGTSHAYEYGGDYREPPRYAPGLLAADFVWDGEVRAYRIEHIARGLTWEKDQSSPLAAPGVNARVGEHLVAINGRRLTANTSVNESTVLLAGREIEVTLRGLDGETRKHTVKTISSEFGPRYRDWVSVNRTRVHAASSGKLGYVHIPDMSAHGFAEFHRGFLAEQGREGLVVDIRNNGGGHVSQLILEKLARRRIGYDVGRWTKPMPYPEESVPGPIVAVTDENAGSDGDIFSHCFKLMKLGPLVGKRTWGGVVGIWPRHVLVDRSMTTQPEFAFWFEDVGFGVENWGTEPDVDVDLPPGAVARGEDPQLDTAIDIAMEQLKASPPVIPDFANTHASPKV